MDRSTTGRRIKAARQLISLTVPQLAENLDLPGLGAKTLGSIERGTRELRPHEIAPLARALQVPETFLTGEHPAGERRRSATIEGDLAAILTAIQTQLKLQTAVLEEIRGHARVVERMLEEQRELKGETDEHLRRLGRAIVQGHSEAPRDRPPSPGLPSVEAK